MARQEHVFLCSRYSVDMCSSEMLRWEKVGVGGLHAWLVFSCLLLSATTFVMVFFLIVDQYHWMEISHIFNILDARVMQSKAKPVQHDIFTSYMICTRQNAWRLRLPAPFQPGCIHSHLGSWHQFRPEHPSFSYLPPQHLQQVSAHKRFPEKISPNQKPICRRVLVYNLFGNQQKNYSKCGSVLFFQNLQN